MWRPTLHDGMSLNFQTSQHYVKAIGGVISRGALTDFFTFTGGNQSMYMGPAGLLVPSVTNTPRIDYDASGNCRGLLMEASRTNLWLRSQEFDNASWSKVRATVSANTIAGPDGTTTADTLVEDGTAANTHLLRQDYASATSGTTYTLSVFAKAKERSQIVLLFGADTAAFANEGVLFTLSGSGTAAISTGSPVAHGIEALANGWYRCWASATCASTTNAVLRIYLASSNSSTYSGDGASGLYLWGGQLEAGRFLSSYIPTTTVSVARTADSCIRTLGSEFSATAGTVVVRGRASGGQDAANAQSVWEFNDGTASNRVVQLRTAAGDLARYSVFTAGAQQGPLDGTFTNASNFKSGIAWAANDLAYSFNGAAVTTDASATLPTGITKLEIGSLTGGGLQMNGHILTFDYYPTRLPNADLVRLAA